MLNIKQLSWLIGLSALSGVASCAEREYPWLDDIHHSIASSVTDSARWFDNFFADENAETSNAWGEARIRLGWEPRSRDLTEFESRLRLRVKLPKMQNQTDLVFSDYDDTDPESQVKAARTNPFDNEDRFNLAIRWRGNPKKGWSHRLGVGRRLQMYYRLRYQMHFPLSDVNNLRTEASVHYYNRDRGGATLRASLDHQFRPYSILRVNNHFFYRDKSDDWLWQHSVQHLYQLEDQSAIIAGVYVEGLSQPNYHVQEYLTSVRWRASTLRKWLFYEIEPFVLWRRDEGFSASYGIALRLEGFFGSTD